MALNDRCPKCGTRTGAEDFAPSGELDCLLCKKIGSCSPHEQLARERKAAKLVAAIDRSAKNQGLDPYDQAGRILLASMGWTEAHWAGVAKLADCNVPSPFTQRMVRDVYRNRVEGQRAAS